MENLEARVTADIGDFQRKFAEMKTDLASLAKSVEGPAKDASGALAGIRNETEQISRLMRGGAILELGRAITESVVAPMISLGREMVMLGDKQHQTETAFRVLVGSAEEAHTLLTKLRDFAAATPFEFPDLVRASEKMLALGVSSKDVLPMLQLVGDAASALGSGSVGMDRIILALGQMQAKGTVQAGEMKQLAEAGIRAWDALAKHLNVTVAEAMEMVTKKQVSSQEGLAAIQAEMAARFTGMMDEQSKTIEGRMSNLRDTLGFLMADLGREIIDALNLSEVLGSVQEFATSFLTWFKSLDQGTKQVLLVFTATFAAGGPILVVVGAFMLAFSALTAPMLVGGAIVAGIVAGVTLILLNWTKIRDTGVAIWTGVRDKVVGTAEAIYTGIKTWLLDKAEAIAGKLQTVAQSFAKPFEWLADHLVLHSVVPDMVDAIAAEMDRLPAVMGQPAEAAVGRVARQIEAFDVNTTSSVRNTVANTARILEGGALTWQGVINQFTTFANNTWGAITQTVGSNIARMTDEHVKWGEVIKQIGLQVMSGIITLSLQTAAQYLISLAQQQTAHAATEAAKTAATVAGETARAGMVMATNKMLSASVISTLAGIAAVGNAAVAILGTVLAVTAGTLATIGGALVATVVGAPLGAAFLTAASEVLIVGTPVVAAAMGAVQGAIGAAIVAASAGLAVPAFATGGAVFGPTLALVGENASRANPEYIGHANQLGLSGRAPQTIVLQVNSRELQRWVLDELPSYVRLRTGIAAA